MLRVGPSEYAPLVHILNVFMAATDTLVARGAVLAGTADSSGQHVGAWTCRAAPVVCETGLGTSPGAGKLGRLSLSALWKVTDTPASGAAAAAGGAHASPPPCEWTGRPVAAVRIPDDVCLIYLEEITEEVGRRAAFCMPWTQASHGAHRATGLPFPLGSVWTPRHLRACVVAVGVGGSTACTAWAWAWVHHHPIPDLQAPHAAADSTYARPLKEWASVMAWCESKTSTAALVEDTKHNSMWLEKAWRCPYLDTPSASEDPRDSTPRTGTESTVSGASTGDGNTDSDIDSDEDSDADSDEDGVGNNKRAVGGIGDEDEDEDAGADADADADADAGAVPSTL